MTMPCDACGREGDDRHPDGRYLCGECDPRTTPKDRAMLYAMRLGVWQPYLRPIFPVAPGGTNTLP
jgi:hypothetical protein